MQLRASISLLLPVNL